MDYLFFFFFCFFIQIFFPLEKWLPPLPLPPPSVGWSWMAVCMQECLNVHVLIETRKKIYIDLLKIISMLMTIQERQVMCLIIIIIIMIIRSMIIVVDVTIINYDYYYYY